VNNTPAEDYQVERAIYYNNTGLASYVSDSGWSTLATNTESYAAAKARVEDYIRGGTYGKLPCTFAIVRTEETIRTGLLVDYPGAAAAYSLRLLDTDYAGSAVRVRRASDNAEQDIGFDAGGDLDTTSLATFCSGTDGFVKVWYDQAGANDATQTTTGNQPKIYDSATGVVTENGKPAVEFDGTNDGLNCATDLRASTGASTVIMTRNVDIKEGQESNVFAFYKVQRHLIEKAGNTNYNEIAIGTNETSGEYIKFPSTDLTGQHLFFSTWDGTTQNGTVDDVVLYYDASLQSQTVLSFGFGVTPSGTNSIGYRNDTNSQFCVGTIQEVIVYLTDESSNRTGIESNINTYYSIYP
jgi:hypothetical protein